MAVSLQGVEMLTRARSLGADLGPLGGDNRADPGVRVLAAGSAPLHSVEKNANAYRNTFRKVIGLGPSSAFFPIGSIGGSGLLLGRVTPTCWIIF